MGLGPSLWARDIEEKNLGGDEQSQPYQEEFVLSVASFSPDSRRARIRVRQEQR